jgi:hypothetical protein
MVQPDTPDDFKRVLEVALLAASGPLTVAEMRGCSRRSETFDDGTLRTLLDDLRERLAGRGVELAQTGWRLALSDPAGISGLSGPPQAGTAAEVFARSSRNPGDHCLSSAGDPR